ncbi:hypothetical protein HMPREF1408_00355 [Helicobacter pylori GAM245Ai]|nr:hypothetical protein HMPREF1408_00355 [Helicobacter pylori GAM245Ai]EMH30438.1 hypothetical protein HMPREF1423_00563 [Helicobacter pylori GAM270ASi]
MGIFINSLFYTNKLRSIRFLIASKLVLKDDNFLGLASCKTMKQIA